jgi:hypothetical protein
MGGNAGVADGGSMGGKMGGGCGARVSPGARLSVGAEVRSKLGDRVIGMDTFGIALFPCWLMTINTVDVELLNPL